MAFFTRTMNNDVPFVANVPVFASATGLLLKGGILSRITANTATGTYFGLTTAADTAQCKFALGPLMMSDSDGVQSKENNAMNAAAFRFGTSNIPNRGAVTGYNWMNAVINHDQFNIIAYDQVLVANLMSANISVTTGTVVTVTGSEASVAGAWLFSTDTSAAATTNTFSGQLRYVSLIGGTGTLGLTTAMNASADSQFVFMRPISHRFTQLDTTGRFLMSTSAAGAGVTLHVYENYISHSQSSPSALRFWIQDGLNGLAVKTVQMYSEVLFLHHAFRQTA